MSGAKNCPETPRQRMIGMMYLVLTAMLALNVSSEILNGFTMVDNSLHKTIESAEVRNKNLYLDFKSLFEQNPDKVGKWLADANKVKKESDELYNYIEDFKKQIVRMTDKDEANDSAYVKQIKAKDNMDIPGQYGLKEGHATLLRQKIEKYRDFLIGLSVNNPTKQQIYRDIFATNKARDGKTWEIATFEMMPISAVITVLTKYQSDIRSSEAEIVQYLKGQTDVKDFRVNKITAEVVPNTPYVIKGGKYSARIILAAEDSTKKPEYYIGGTRLAKGLYEVTGNTAGNFTYSGMIKLQGNDGSISTYPFKSEYVVGEPSASISNEDLNVVYRGIDNKFNISVPGVPSENVSISVTGGNFQKVGQRYIIKPMQDGEIYINVFAKIQGTQMKMGGGAYRVKYIPDPKSFLQYTDGGGVVRQTQDDNLTKKTLLSESVVLIASYGPDELIKANFSVVSFTMVSPNGIEETRGAKFNSKMRSYISSLEGGDFLILKNIKAIGPDGKLRSLSPIQIQI
ncbi:MAG TPA: gliding motility protein GldM [Paludibacter sp.]|nr:gliding motility protein GldM [Paludibacter sp.]